MTKSAKDVEQAIAVWQKQIDAAQSTFKATLKSAGPKGNEDAAVTVFNAQATCMLALADANETLGYGFRQNDVRNLTIKAWIAMQTKKKEKNIAFDRIAAVQAAYKEKVHIPNMGAKDGAMEHALAFAALMDKNPEDVDKILSKIKDMLQNGEHLTTQSACEALPESEQKTLGNFYSSYVSERETETVRKSIQRLRDKLKRHSFVHLDHESLQLRMMTAEEAYFDGMPKGRGRPKKL